MNIEGQNVIPVSLDEVDEQLIGYELQSLADISLKASGSVDSLMDLALANNMSITDDVAPGTRYKGVAVDNQLVYEYYKQNDIEPTTFELVTAESLLFEAGLFETELFE